MTNIIDRYARAIRSSNLKSRENAIVDVDIIGAFGIADRRLTNDQHKKHPLAVQLQRMFLGNKENTEFVEILAGMIRAKAKNMNLSMSHRQAYDMARVLLGWFRNPSCRRCGGHGYYVIHGTTTIGDVRCRPCEGTGKVQIELLYPQKVRDLVRWAVAKVDAESGLTGPAAMQALGRMMEF